MCAAAGRGLLHRQLNTCLLQHLPCFSKEQQSFITLLRVHVSTETDSTTQMPSHPIFSQFVEQKINGYDGLHPQPSVTLSYGNCASGLCQWLMDTVRILTIANVGPYFWCCVYLIRSNIYFLQEADEEARGWHGIISILGRVVRLSLSHQEWHFNMLPSYLWHFY